MLNNDTMIFKIASEPWEFAQIHELNYQTFVEEIPQHPHNENRKLVDKYHTENTYFIGIKDSEVLGMLALRAKRPFSLDGKLEDLESYLPKFKSIVEIRLLAVRKKVRKTSIFAGIIKKSFEWGLKQGYDLAVISGTTRQIRLYEHLGFKPFGSLVGTPDALYQPMVLNFNDAMLLKKNSQLFNAKKNRREERLIFNYLPGPVSIIKGVAEAFSAKPNSHRGEHFVRDFNALRSLLCKRVNAQNVQIMAGAGTLANAIVAAHLAVLAGKGLILINGEFGERLHEQAIRAGLDFDIITAQEGKTFKPEEIEEKIQSVSGLSWIWTVHCETSTGVINDILVLRKLCNRHNLKLCLDGISSIGSCHVDLQDVYLTSAVSGKGVGSLPGLIMVFYRDGLATGNQKIPCYFDLELYEAKDGIPFTISSNAIYALQAAIKNSDWGKRFDTIKRWSEILCEEIEELGLKILADKSIRASHVITIVLPTEISSLSVGRFFKNEGILISYGSEYLIRKNHIQVVIMGESQKPTHRIVYFLRKFLEEVSKP